MSSQPARPCRDPTAQESRTSPFDLTTSRRYTQRNCSRHAFGAYDSRRAVIRDAHRAGRVPMPSAPSIVSNLDSQLRSWATCACRRWLWRRLTSHRYDAVMRSCARARALSPAQKSVARFTLIRGYRGTQNGGTRRQELRAGARSSHLSPMPPCNSGPVSAPQGHPPPAPLLGHTRRRRASMRCACNLCRSPQTGAPSGWAPARAAFSSTAQ
jgi:hypothetical protein